jgi:uncharacterized protein YndB with AHSA1/START domain
MSRIITNEILIHAPASKVWRALTDPSETKQYMFGCETVSDWNIGSPLLWEGTWEGKKMVFVKGHIANIIPDRHLTYTVFDPNNPAMEDVPENYLTVTYDLSEEEHGTRLTVTQGDFSKVADGERRYQESYNNGEGWNPILKKIKEQVESAA